MYETLLLLLLSLTDNCEVCMIEKSAIFLTQPFAECHYEFESNWVMIIVRPEPALPLSVEMVGNEFKIFKLKLYKADPNKESFAKKKNNAAMVLSKLNFLFLE